MNDVAAATPLEHREAVLFALCEAAELEHNLMCTYLYAAFSLRDSDGEGLDARELAAVRRWKQVLLGVAIEEMGHLTAVWNITSALGGSPRVGRTNFPLDPGMLPASVVVKLVAFDEQTLQHFVFLERPHGSSEPDGEGFAYASPYLRGGSARLTPVGLNYDTVGDFYQTLGGGLQALVQRLGEKAALDGDRALQLTRNEVDLAGAQQVVCLKTALAAFHAIVRQGEGAPQDSSDSHYQKFLGIRTELDQLKTRNPNFVPAFRAATNPVLRRPPRPEGRVWLETPEAVATVDLANACYGLMLRLLAYAYVVPGPGDEKSLVVDLAIGLMRALAPLGEHAARLPAGPSNPHCNAGVSFIAPRDPSPLPRGTAARRLFVERCGELANAGAVLAGGGAPRLQQAAAVLTDLSRRAQQEFELMTTHDPKPTAAAAAPTDNAAVTQTGSATAPTVTASAALSGGAASLAGAAAGGPSGAGADGIEHVAGRNLELQFDAKRCIHSRFCVTWTPDVFLANVQGPWIHPDAMAVESVVEVAHACPSGAIRYQRTDGGPQEAPPPVNLVSVREGGPYALRADIRINGKPAGYRLTLCRCGASKNKPYCDGSHHEIGFNATGEPPTGETDMLAVRNGPLAVDPQPNGPLRVRGNLEIISGTGRCVGRSTSAWLCRCGGSANKPYCDGTHKKIGFVAD